METKMEQRPTQFPASFPDTFKDFFSMVNEEEDHIELFSNLLEDKVIPRTNKCRYRGSRTRNSANSTNVGRSNSFRLMRSGSDYCKHMRYCCLHQNHLINSHNELEYMNISDDEKQMKKFGLLKEVSHEKGCNCEHCEETDTISTCSSNNTTSYSCLLRHNKSLRNRGNLTRNTGNTISTSPLLCAEQNQMSTSSSPSTVPSDFTKTINDNNNICSCKSPTDIQQIKSPMINRRRASSIAAAHLSTEQRLLKVDDQYSRSGNTFIEPHSRFSHSKSPLTVCPSAFAKQIDGTNNVPTKQKQRMRTSSMPAENRKPRLADTRRAAIHCADMDLEYYRLRSFSITSHGICNLGDSMRSRRSRSINSVTSTATSHSGKDRNNSNASQTSAERIKETDLNEPITAYKIAMLGDAGVGKTALTYQFTTSDYICAYDLSLDDDYGQKTVSVLLDGQETDLEIIDHPACEMSTEAFCSTYNVDLFVVVYSVVDRKSFKTAEQILHYLKDGEMLLTRGAILVGNKIDLERHREVPRQAARRTAKEVACKFIETSSGIDHNVNELLVGIVAQVKLNPLRINNLTEKQRLSLNTTNTIHRHRKLTVNERPLQRMPKPHNIQKRETEERNSDKKSNQIETNFNDHFRKVKQSDNQKDDCNDHDDDDRRHNCNPNYQDNRNDNVDDEAVDKEVSLINKINEPSCSLPNNCDSYDSQQRHTPKPTNLLDEKTVSKMSNRTKLFLTSFLKFKRTLRVKRRNSNSCSDLFVI